MYIMPIHSTGDEKISSNNASSDDATEAGCGCLTFLFGIVAIVWFLSGYLGFWKAILVGLVVVLMIGGLGIMGIVPFLGQWLSRLYAPGVIVCFFRILQVNPDIQLSIPRWINSILKWIAGSDEITGSLASYTFATGYALSAIVSLSIVVGIILRIFRKKVNNVTLVESEETSAV